MRGIITAPRACASEQIISLHLTNRAVDISEKLASVCFKPSDLQMPMSIMSGGVVVFFGPRSHAHRPHQWPAHAHYNWPTGRDRQHK